MIGKYAQWANNLEEQITTLNNARKENTGIVGGIGDWVGEKTGAYSTGKEAYEEQIKQIQDRAKALHAQIINEFSEKTLSEDEKTSIQKLIQKLKIQTGARLEHVGWARAVSNSLDDNQNLPSDLGSKTFHMTLGAMEGGYESVAGMMEISGKAIGICTAYIGSAVSEGKFDASVGKQISADVARIFSLLTLKNAQKAIALLPKALESFMNAKPDVQAEGFGKFFGMIIAPLGIGAKTVTAAKSVGEAGMATVKAGAEIMKKGGARAVAAGMATITLGTGELAVAGTAVAGGTAVRYAGEMGAGGKGKISEKAEKAALADKIAKAEARSGVPYETVFRNSALPEAERFKLATNLLGHKLTEAQEKAIRKIHGAENSAEKGISKGIYENSHPELRAMVEELDKVGISREQGRKLMENGVLGSDTELVLQMIKSTENMPVEMLRNFLKSDSPEVRLAVLRKMDTSPTRIPEDIVREASKDASELVQSYLTLHILNMNTPIDIFENLAQSKYDTVLLALVKRSIALPEKIYEALILNGSASVQSRVLSRIKDVNIKNYPIYLSLVKNAKDEYILTELIDHFINNGGHIPEPLKRHLVASKSENTREWLYSQPWKEDIAFFGGVLDDTKAVKLAAISNPKLEGSWILGALSRDGDESVRNAALKILGQKGIPAKAENLTGDTVGGIDLNALRAKVTANPMDQSTIMAVLKGKVSQSKSPIIEETIPHDKTNLLKFLREASRNNTDNVSKIFDNHTLLDGSKIEINNSLGLLKDGKPWLLDGKRVGAIEKVQQLPNGQNVQQFFFNVGEWEWMPQAYYILENGKYTPLLIDGKKVTHLGILNEFPEHPYIQLQGETKHSAYILENGVLKKWSINGEEVTGHLHHDKGAIQGLNGEEIIGLWIGEGASNRKGYFTLKNGKWEQLFVEGEKIVHVEDILDFGDKKYQYFSGMSSKVNGFYTWEGGKYQPFLVDGKRVLRMTGIQDGHGWMELEGGGGMPWRR